MELKNILARQPGQEVHAQLEQYRNTIKEKTGQMRKMVDDCAKAQQQQQLFEFEIKRLKEDIGAKREDYFSLRQQQDKLNYQENQQAGGPVYENMRFNHDPS